MEKYIVIKASNGVEIIDSRPEAEIVSENEKYLLETYNRKKANQLHKNKHPFVKVLANAMGSF